MSVPRSLAKCSEVLEHIHMLMHTKHLKSLPDSEDEFTQAFSRLKSEIAGQSLNINDRENMLNLDQQLRQLQRGLRKEMRGFSEKLHMLEAEQKRAHKALQYLKIP